MKMPLRRARSALAALILVTPVVLVFASASAAPQQSVEYDALGDS